MNLGLTIFLIGLVVAVVIVYKKKPEVFNGLLGIIPVKEVNDKISTDLIPDSKEIPTIDSLLNQV